MASFEDYLCNLFSQPTQADEAQERRRASFRNVNASMALEGFEIDNEQLALQEEIINGRLTTEQAIALLIAKYSENVAC